ncbi:MAG: hypothetical protein V1702_06630 [Candidatus Woesearchaeota archaeon]
MCNEFFRPTWKKVIGFLVVNCTALLAYLMLKLVFTEGWMNSFLTYFYLVLSPFVFLLNLLASALLVWGIPIGTFGVITLSLVQNVLEIAWHYAVACFVIAGYCMLKGRKGVILKPKKRKK